MSTVGPISSLLPELPGVCPLTRNEIKKDINLIESYYDSDDSDDSVSSSEAVTSSYPVKPRNFAKPLKKDEVGLSSRDVPQSHVDVGGGMSMDDAVEFMKTVEMARPDVYEGEKERENLEIRYQALRETCVSQSESFLENKKEQKNFIQAVQGSCRVRCQQFDVLGLKNSMLHDMIVSLQKTRANLFFLNNTVSTLGQGQDHDQREELIRKLKDQQQLRAKTFHFYKGLRVYTPIGPGNIVSIDPREEKVSIKLPFGMMYSTFTSVIAWASATTTSTIDINSADNLRSRWARDMNTPSNQVGMSDKRLADIQLLLKEEGRVPFNDAGVASGEWKESTGEHNTASSSSAWAQSRRTSGRCKESSTNSVPAPIQSNLRRDEVFTTVSTNSANIEESKRSVYLDHSKKLPLLFCPSGIAPYLVSSYSGNYVTEKTLACERAKNSDQRTVCQRMNSTVKGSRPEAEYCMNAFHRSESISFFCDVDSRGDGALVRDRVHGDEGSKFRPDCRFNDYAQQIVNLKKNLRPMLQKIKECRKRKRQLAHQVEHTKLNTVQISQQISKMRLDTFTKRVLFRQNLIANGGMALKQENCPVVVEVTENSVHTDDTAAPAPTALVRSSQHSTSAADSKDKGKDKTGKGSPFKDKNKNKNKNKEKGKTSGPPSPSVVDSLPSNSKRSPSPPAASSPSQSSAPNARRKSTRTAVVAITASSDSNLPSSRAKRKKDDADREESTNSATSSAATNVKSSATSEPVTSTSRSSSSQSSSTTNVLKRNPKRSRR